MQLLNVFYISNKFWQFERENARDRPGVVEALAMAVNTSSTAMAVPPFRPVAAAPAGETAPRDQYSRLSLNQIAPWRDRQIITSGSVQKSKGLEAHDQDDDIDNESEKVRLADAAARHPRIAGRLPLLSPHFR